MPFFPNSRNFVAYGPFVDVTIQNEMQFIKGTGFDALRKASIPEAIHDSSARDPAPRCLPGTRDEHLCNITGWGVGEWKARQARMLWLHGPAGVGKSALAQTCVERIGDRLSASFFFSRPNGWNNAANFVPTIVYQLATKCMAYRSLVDIKIAHDPFILEKSIDVQFRELLLKPLGQLSDQDRGFSDNVILVDGLDECDGQDAQRIIIEVVTASVLQQSTPFLWAFFSRPEPHIVAAFSSERTREICWRMMLPVSRRADQDVEAYLRDGFRMIRARYNLPAVIVWPSEENIRQLVRQSAGLFAYPASIIKHIAQSPGTLGPEQQLQSVLEVEKTRIKGRSPSPLSNLDKFYVLLMKQIPKDILPTTLLLLFAHLHRIGSFDNLPIYCSILNFSPTTVYAALNNLHSVLGIEVSFNGMPNRLSFYHASFADFLDDVTRSTPEYCVKTPDIYNRFYSMCVDVLYRLSSVSANEDGCSANMLTQWPSSLGTKKKVCSRAVEYLFKLAKMVDLETDVLQRLSCINWGVAAKLCHLWACDAGDIEAFIRKVPESWRPKIIRPFDNGLVQACPPIQQSRFPEHLGRQHYVLGNGSNAALLLQGAWYYCIVCCPNHYGPVMTVVK